MRGNRAVVFRGATILSRLVTTAPARQRRVETEKDGETEKRR